MSPLANYAEQFAATATAGGAEGPAWLPALRQRAFDRFHALGFPTTRQEEWIYTNVAPIARTQFRLAERRLGILDLAAIAPWSLADEAVPHPLDPIAVAEAIAGLARARVRVG